MIILGVDYHPSDQYIAFVDTETGEYVERQLNHGDREAEKFYRGLAAQGVSVRVGMEVTGYSRWFERLLAELGIEVWIGDAAEIKTKPVRKQKTDREDARLMLRLMRENNFSRDLAFVQCAEMLDRRRVAVRNGTIGSLKPACCRVARRGSNADQQHKDCSNALPLARHSRSYLGTQSGESSPATTALAPASDGADADADHESAAGPGDERRPATEEKTVERTRTSTAGKASAS